MLWAIDVGNTHTVYGRWDGQRWRAQWRLPTDPSRTEDQLAAELASLCALAELPFSAQQVVIGSVNPGVNEALDRLAREWLGAEPIFLRSGEEVGLRVTYDPPRSVGPDRIANALGVLNKFQAPAIVVDFGTATTFDAISGEGVYLGGAILPGINLAFESLYQKAALLPRVPFRAPETTIGKDTPGAIQSGVVLGYAFGIEGLAVRMKEELGGEALVISTGGLGEQFLELCPSIERYDADLTLDGLVEAHRRLTA